MIKYKCDICGKEVVTHGGNNKWKILSLTSVDITDVCPECFQGIGDAIKLMMKAKTSSVADAMMYMCVEEGQHDFERFKLGETIKYSPTEMRDIVEKRLKNE